jgi:hypothetical protein
MARQFQWLSADGRYLIDLTDRASGYRVQAEGTSGLNAPPYRFTTNTYAGLDGVDVQGVSADAREVTLGLLIHGDDEDMLDARVSALTRAMRPKAGPGTLAVTSATGRRRTLTCYYQSGLEGVESRGAKLPGAWWKFAVRLLAGDPWFYGEPQAVSFGLGAPTSFFPIFPLVLSPSTVQGEFTVDLSDTDTPTYPVWTITGPGSSLLLTNETTGRQIQVNASLAAGEVMVIDTRPGMQSIRRGGPGGPSLMDALASGPSLWPLIEDVNAVTAALIGATSDSRIAAMYSPRYAGA